MARNSYAFVDEFIFDRCSQIDDSFNRENGVQRISSVTVITNPKVQNFFLDRRDYICTVDWSMLNCQGNCN